MPQLATQDLSKRKFNGLRIRDATVDDASAVAILIEQLGYPCSRDDAFERIQRVTRDSQQKLRVAEQDGFVAGLIGWHFLYYLPIGRITCRITALVVHDRVRKSGIGNALMKHIEQEARQANAARIELTTAESRNDAHRFYRGHGYQEQSLRFMKRLGDA